jgi:hypothetical protein
MIVTGVLIELKQSGGKGSKGKGPRKRRRRRRRGREVSEEVSDTDDPKLSCTTQLNRKEGIK